MLCIKNQSCFWHIQKIFGVIFCRKKRLYRNTAAFLLIQFSEPVLIYSVTGRILIMLTRNWSSVVASLVVSSPSA